MRRSVTLGGPRGLLAAAWASVLVLFFFVSAGCERRPTEPSSFDDAVAVTPGDVTSNGAQSGTVIVSDAPGDLGDDAYALNAARIAGDKLTLNLSYGGGCAEHEFTLVAAEAFIESSPVQLAVHLAHDAHGDPCEAWLTTDYEFDLTAIRDRYQQQYGSAAGRIVLSLAGVPAGSLEYVFP